MKAPAGVAEEKPRRMTQGEILAALIERYVSSAGTEHSSVELARNAKGDVQIKVTVRTGESDEVRTVEEAAAKARSTYDALAAIYPMDSIAPAPAASRSSSPASAATRAPARKRSSSPSGD